MCLCIIDYSSNNDSNNRNSNLVCNTGMVFKLDIIVSGAIYCVKKSNVVLFKN